MGKIIIKRLLQTIPTLLVVVTLTFCLTRMLPGDPAVAILGIEANAEDIEAMRAEMNLDKSLPEQYALYLGGLVHGDFGYSYSYRQDVLPLITSRIPNTLTLTLTALLFAFIIGTSVGIIAALKQNTIFDYIVMVITLVGVSMPIFWLALMLVLQFSVKMNLLPVMGMGDLSKGFGDVVSHMILPGFCLATIPMATFARTMRSSMIDIMSSDYIRCLRARGIKKLKVILIHGLKNALPPLITVLGLQIAGTFTGAIITEGIFSWPGMGTMINTAINNRDYSLIQGGGNWYDKDASCEILLDEEDTLKLQIGEMYSKERRTVAMKLDGLPERPPKASRLRVEIAFTSGTTMKVKVTDLGFGDLYPSTGKVWEEVLTEKGGDRV